MIDSNTTPGVAIQKLISCLTIRDKTIALALLSALSLILAIAVDYLCFLAVGQTSLGTWYNPYWIGFFFICGLLLSSFFVFRHDIKTKPENLFLAIVLSITCFSSISFYINEPAWDPGTHYSFVLHFGSLNLNTVTTVSDMEMVRTLTNDNYFNLKELNDYASKLNEENMFLDGKIYHGTILAAYFMVASLPASLVYIVCTALSVPFSIKFVLVRLVYAIISSLITYFGMKQLKSGKMLFAVIALLPTAVFIASNYGYDYWVNAFVLLGVACLVRELQTPDVPITKKRMILLLGAFLLAFGPKAIYFPLVFICFLLPRKKFSSVRAFIIFRGGIVFVSLFAVASFVLPFFVIYGGPPTGDIRGGEEVSTVGQMSFILSSPFEYARILLHNLPYYYSFEASKYYIGFYAYLGFLSRPLWVLVFVLMIITALTDKSELDKMVCTWKSRTLSITLNLITFILVMTALYVSFTGVGNTVIAGVQPRYMIPLLFFTLIFLSSYRLAWPRKNNKIKTIYNSAVLGIMSFVLMVGLWQVYFGLLY